MSKPTCEKMRSKRYRCSECGHEKEIQTNHYGECYSFGNYNRCPKCPTYNGPTIWVCQEQPPDHMDKPEPWKIAKLGDVVNIVRPRGNTDESEVIQ